MGYDRAAPRRPVNLNINSDLVERCRTGVDNLSAHVERLLVADLERREASAAAERVATERAIDAFTELYRRDGSLSEELQDL
jgi:antitoxin CcdA